MKNRCDSNETDPLVSPRAEESSQTRGEGKRSERTIVRPDSIVTGQWPRRIFMRRYFDEIVGSEMLLRVVVEETDVELTVVTLYKTSKFAKYEGAA